MKNLMTSGFLVLGLIVGNLAAANAQTGPMTATSENVKVNLIFKDILAIEVAPNQRTVDLVFQTVDHYLNGVTSDVKTGHLTVTSTKPGYEVKVKTIEQTFTGANATPLNVGQVYVKANNTDFGTSTGEIQLDANNARTIFTGNSASAATVGKKIDVVYAAKGNEITNNGAIERNYVGKTVSANVQYSITVQ